MVICFKQSRFKSNLLNLPVRRAVVFDTSAHAYARKTTARLCIKQTQFRKMRHGAERGFALTRLAKSSLIRLAVAVAFSCGNPWCFVYCKMPFAVSSFVVATQFLKVSPTNVYLKMCFYIQIPTEPSLFHKNFP